MDTWHYLERVRTLNKGCTDYRLAQVLGVRQQTMVNYRQGRQMDDGVAARVAELLDLPAIIVIADVNKARAQADADEAMVATWGKIADFARRHAHAAVLVLAIFAATAMYSEPRLNLDSVAFSQTIEMPAEAVNPYSMRTF